MLEDEYYRYRKDTKNAFSEFLVEDDLICKRCFNQLSRRDKTKVELLQEEMFPRQEKVVEHINYMGD